MATKKKRNKPYKGNAALTRPVITRVNAVNRNRVHQWWIDHQQIARPILMVVGIGLVVIIIIIGVIGLVF